MVEWESGTEKMLDKFRFFRHNPRAIKFEEFHVQCRDVRFGSSMQDVI